ncbi:MAG: LCP family protein [Acidimicrobiales bacterium]
MTEGTDAAPGPDEGADAGPGPDDGAGQRRAAGADGAPPTRREWRAAAKAAKAAEAAQAAGGAGEDASSRRERRAAAKAAEAEAAGDPRASRRERRAAAKAAEAEAAAGAGGGAAPSRRGRRGATTAEAGGSSEPGAPSASRAGRRPAADPGDAPPAVGGRRAARRAADTEPAPGRAGARSTAPGPRRRAAAGPAGRAGGGAAPAAAGRRPPAPSAAGRATAASRGSAVRPVRPLSPQRQKVLRQRRRRRRTIIGLTIFLVVANLVVGGAAAYVRIRLGEIHKVKIPELTGDAPGQVMNVLLVGSDSRAGLTGQEAAADGADQVSGQRSDTIMVMHIDPAQTKATILSIPRDLYLPIAGTGRSDKINAAFSLGGARQLIATIQQSLGIQINHYAEADFVGFKEIVDAVGGVTVYVPAQARDTFSGLQVGTPGCFRLDGIAALAWVRSRHYEYMSNGEWIPDPRGDLGRIERQQDFIRRMIKKAASSGISNPLTLNRLIGIGVHNLTVDATMSTGDITHLARRFSSVDPDSVQTLTLPTTPADLGGPGGSILKLNQAEAQATLDAINGKAPATTTTTSTVPPTTGRPTTTVPPVTSAIQVLNATSTVGLATKAAAQLTAAGYKVSGTGDASPAAHTVVRYPTGGQAQAQALAARLAGPSQLKVDPTLKPKTLALVAGSDYSGATVVAAGPPPPSTSTTIVPSTLVPAPLPSNPAPRKGC